MQKRIKSKASAWPVCQTFNQCCFIQKLLILFYTSSCKLLLKSALHFSKNGVAATIPALHLLVLSLQTHSSPEIYWGSLGFGGVPPDFWGGFGLHGCLSTRKKKPTMTANYFRRPPTNSFHNKLQENRNTSIIT